MFTASRGNGECAHDLFNADVESMDQRAKPLRDSASMFDAQTCDALRGISIPEPEAQTRENILMVQPSATLKAYEEGAEDLIGRQATQQPIDDLDAR